MRDSGFTISREKERKFRILSLSEIMRMIILRPDGLSSVFPNHALGSLGTTVHRSVQRLSVVIRCNGFDAITGITEHNNKIAKWVGGYNRRLGWGIKWRRASAMYQLLLNDKSA